MPSKTKARVTDTLANAAGKKKATKKAKPATLINHVAIIVDESSSMNGWQRQVVNTVNEQFANMRAASDAEGQQTFVTLRTFSSYVNRPVISQQDVGVLRNWTARDYNPGGMTALYDAIGYTMQDLERVRDANKDHVSFLLIVVTDGWENRSRKFQYSIADKIKAAQKTDRWSVVCLVPPGERQATARRLGVPVGNVREWEQSEAGFDDMRRNVGAGLTAYYSARSSGLRSTKSFFVDTRHIDTDDLENLDDVSGDFVVWNVDTVANGEKVRIDDFVNERLSRNARMRRQLGDQYQIRRGYYELTKPEKVQPSKDMVIQDLDTGKMYGGFQARSLLGLPDNEYIRVRPGDHSQHRIFILSTSINRNLIGGTKFLYRKS